MTLISWRVKKNCCKIIKVRSVFDLCVRLERLIIIHLKFVKLLFIFEAFRDWNQQDAFAFKSVLKVFR